MARAVVTGCAGFIGSHLTEALLEDGHSVLGVDCFNDNYARADKRANLAPRRRVRRVRAADRRPRERRRDRCSTGRRRLPPGRRAGRARQLGHALRPLHAPQRPGHAASAGSRARAAGAPLRLRVVVESIYGDALTLPTHEDETPRPLSPYGVTKLAAEHLCVLYGEEHGVDTVALRYFSVYGPRQRPDMAFRRFCEAIVEGEPLELYGDGRQTRDFTYVGDIVAATRAAARRGPPRAASSTSAAASARAWTARSRSSPATRAARSTSAAATASPATCATPAPTPRALATSSASPRERASTTASPRSWTGCASAASAGTQLDRILTFPAPPLERAFRYPGCAPLQPESQSPGSSRRLDRRALRADQPPRARIRHGGRPSRQPRQGDVRRRAGVPCRRRRGRRDRGDRLARRRARAGAAE